MHNNVLQPTQKASGKSRVQNAMFSGRLPFERLKTGVILLVLW
jgi:hypothetical protein